MGSNLLSHLRAFNGFREFQKPGTSKHSSCLTFPLDTKFLSTKSLKKWISTNIFQKTFNRWQIVSTLSGVASFKKVWNKKPQAKAPWVVYKVQNNANSFIFTSVDTNSSVSKWNKLSMEIYSENHQQRNHESSMIFVLFSDLKIICFKKKYFLS